MKVTAQYAEEHFADIVHTAMRGEDVDIAMPEEASLRLSLLKPAAKKAPRRPRRELWGAGEGLITLPNDEEWKAMDNAFAEEILSHLVFPVEQP